MNKKATPKEIEAARKLLANQGYLVGTLWNIDDIIQRVKENIDSTSYKVTKKDAKEIAKLIEKNHDCNTGINWEVLDAAINVYFD